jgi:hypothetical protein
MSGMTEGRRGDDGGRKGMNRREKNTAMGISKVMLKFVFSLHGCIP